LTPSVGVFSPLFTHTHNTKCLQRVAHLLLVHVDAEPVFTVQFCDRRGMSPTGIPKMGV